MNKRILMVWLAASALAGCSDDGKATSIFDAGGLPVDAAVITGASMDAALGASAADASSTADASVAPPATPPVADCFPAPKTYLELINACTDAEKVDKAEVLPLLGPDGGLPPLP
jgi:hypothetical protein